MTKRNKIILLSSIILALLVITSVLLWGIGNSKTEEGGLNWLMVIILAAAVFSVFIVFFTKIKKHNYEKLLNPPFYEKYEMIKEIIKNSQLSPVNKKEVVEDVIDLALSAQTSGKDPDMVFGDVQEFTTNILASYDNPLRFGLLSVFDSLIAMVLIILGTSVFLWLEMADQSFFSTKVDISMIAFFLVVVFILIPVTKSRFSAKNPWIFLVPLGGGVAFILLAELLRAYFYRYTAVQWFLDGSIPLVPNTGLLMTYVGLVPILLLAKWLVRSRKFR